MLVTPALRAGSASNRISESKPRRWALRKGKGDLLVDLLGDDMLYLLCGDVLCASRMARPGGTAAGVRCDDVPGDRCEDHSEDLPGATRRREAARA